MRGDAFVDVTQVKQAEEPPEASSYVRLTVTCLDETLRGMRRASRFRRRFRFLQKETMKRLSDLAIKQWEDPNCGRCSPKCS